MGSLPGIFCALEFDEFVSALGPAGSESHHLSYGNASPPASEQRSTWPRFVRACERQVSGDSTYAESEWVDWLRLLVSESINSATSAVPFYFQQTLGGSDIDGNMALGSYQDTRFRPLPIYCCCSRV